MDHTELKCYGHIYCENGGKCVEDFPNLSYTCACRPGYIGKHCEIGEYSHVTFMPHINRSHAD